MDLNKSMIIGRLTRDPEIRSTQSGQNVANFSVATGRQWTDKGTGQKKEQTEFHNVVAWGRLADICQQYLKKGNQVYIEGRLQTRSWDDQSGTKRYRTEIIANEMIMLGGRNQGGGNAAPAQAAPAGGFNAPAAAPAQQAADDQGTPPPAAGADEETISIEDIPF